VFIVVNTVYAFNGQETVTGINISAFEQYTNSVPDRGCFVSLANELHSILC
jgi:hypothetical protein